MMQRPSSGLTLRHSPFRPDLGEAKKSGSSLESLCDGPGDMAQRKFGLVARFGRCSVQPSPVRKREIMSERRLKRCIAHAVFRW